MAEYLGMTEGSKYPGFATGNGTFNRVFNLYSNGENQWVKLVRRFKALRAEGEPMVTTLEGLKVIDNPFWGIKGGWSVDLTIFLNHGVPNKFADLIPDDIVPPPEGKSKTEYGFFTNSNLSSVPNVDINEQGSDVKLPLLNDVVFVDIPAMGGSLPVAGVRMTQLLVDWAVSHAWDGLSDSNGEELFGGFRKIFEGSDAGSDAGSDDAFGVSGVDDDEAVPSKKSKNKKTKKPKKKMKIKKSKKAKTMKSG